MAGLLEVFIALTVADQASDKIKKISSTTNSEFGKIGGNISKGLKIVGAGIASAVAGIGTFTTVATKAYADYEQLVGGAKLMFGGAYDFIADKSKNAYSTVQMSQNEYLRQVNGFATGLKTALGGNEQAAAKLADKIINAEADVVAATGNSQEAVQNAFNGIMKSNYTMLDNLQIGITPTKKGFQDVIDKVNAWNAATGHATEYQIENLADCQSALVDYIEMVGLQGYASMEAADTIQGSVASMKAAWQNWLTGLGNSSADMTALSSQLIQSFETVVDNILPVAGNILTALTDTLKTDGPALFGEAFSFISENIPSLVDTGLALLGGIADGITENLPTLLSSGIDIALQIAEGIVSGIPDLIAKAPEIITGLKDAITEKLPDIKEAGQKIVDNLQEALNNAGIDIDLDDVISAFDTLAPAITGVTTALIVFKAASAISGIVNTVSSAITAFKTANDAATISQALLNAVMNANPFVLIITLVAGLVAVIVTLWNTNEGFRNAVTTAWEAIKTVVTTVASAISTAVVAAWDWIQGAWSVAAGFFSGIWSAIVEIFSPVVETLGGFFSDAWEKIKGILDGWAGFFTGVWDDIKSVFSDAVNVGSKIVDDIKSGISSAWDTLTGWFEGIWNDLFGNRKVNVSVTGTTSGAGKAIGMEYIPYNGFPATLHRGEAVLNTVEADRWRRGLDRTGNIISDARAPRINIYDSGNRDVVDVLNLILDSIGTNLNRDIRNGNRGITQRDFARAVRSV